VRPSLGRAVLGGAAIVAGAVLFLSVIGDIDAGAVLGRWWPLVLIALGLVQVATERRLRIGSTVLLGIGLLLLGSTTGLIDASVWPVLGAVALIALGGLVMAPRSSREVAITGDDVAGVVVLGARRFIATSPQVRSGDVTVVAASGVVDLSAAGLAPGARMKLTVLLGGCDVIVPQGWGVRLSGIPLIGMWDNTTRRDLAVDEARTLEVHATVILGGLEVRHSNRWS
jgi:hypothetical protein